MSGKRHTARRRLPKRRPPRVNLPEPVERAHESTWARWRRRARRKALRATDRAIGGLYALISWIDERTPVETRYFRVAIFGSSRIGPDDAAYERRPARPRVPSRGRVAGRSAAPLGRYCRGAHANPAPADRPTTRGTAGGRARLGGQPPCTAPDPLAREGTLP